MTWYKTAMHQVCFKPYMQEEIFVVYSDDALEGDRSPQELALFSHPAYTQSYPIWSSWMNGETIEISEEEALDFLERQKTYDYWSAEKYWLSTKLKVLLFEADVRILEASEEVLALLKYAKSIFSLPVEEGQQPFRDKIRDFFQEERDEIYEKIKKEEEKRTQTQMLFDRFFGFECNEQEQRRIDEYWWHQSNAPGEQEKREAILSDLRTNFKIIRSRKDRWN